LSSVAVWHETTISDSAPVVLPSPAALLSRGHVLTNAARQQRQLSDELLRAALPDVAGEELPLPVGYIAEIDRPFHFELFPSRFSSSRPSPAAPGPVAPRAIRGRIRRMFSFLGGD